MTRLCIVLGDQLDRQSLLFDYFDHDNDVIWMAEVSEECTHVWSHKQRIALFFAAMRHFAAEMQQAGRTVVYRKFGTHQFHSLTEALTHDIGELRPNEVWLVRPGDFRVLNSIAEVCRAADITLHQLRDQHFLSTPAEFKRWADGRKGLRMEYWYRALRRKHDILMDGAEPVGGKWNYDHDNRGSFTKEGPRGLPDIPPPISDGITAEVINTVERHFPTHPGSLKQLDWPVTPAQAIDTLQRFLDECLPRFGEYQDAMWTDEPFLFHSLLSTSLNLKLLHPIQVIHSAEQRYRDGKAPLAAVEGFIRQILGWREYVRGLYWLRMPQWLEMNALGAKQNLPSFFWHGKTDMVCLAQTISQTLQHGYAHHIQRLMVTGLFALMYGVEPKQVHGWYLAVYVDAVEWVELPNTLGMSQYADDGLIASKPYVASGKYIQRMSNYCQQCRYRPDQASGGSACPFTTLYWDFLARHEEKFKHHPRMAFMMKNLARLDPAKRADIRTAASALRAQLQKNT